MAERLKIVTDDNRYLRVPDPKRTRAVRKALDLIVLGWVLANAETTTEKIRTRVQIMLRKLSP